MQEIKISIEIFKTSILSKNTKQENILSYHHRGRLLGIRLCLFLSIHPLLHRHVT